jgi:CheY-like chemotaxis protein
VTPCILVVDDEPPIASFVVAVLAEEGYRTLLAPDGRQALLVAREQRPDFVLADLMMPHMDGAALCRALKADPATQTIPVALMSAAVSRHGEAFGADALLPKPFELDDLLALVERFVGPPCLPSGTSRRPGG